MIEFLSEDQLKAISRAYSGLSRERLRLSSSEVQELLMQDLPDVQVSQLKQFPLGGPNELYRLLLEDSAQELSLKIVNKGAESKHDGYLCARETFALTLASSAQVPVPLVYVSHSDGKNLGRPYFVTECVRGEPLVMTLSELSEESLRQIGYEVGEAVATLHSITFRFHGDLPIPDWSLPTPHFKPILWSIAGTSDEAFVHRVTFILDLYRKHGILLEDDCENLERFFQKRARTLLSSETSSCLVQADIDPKNILISQGKDGWHFVGLVDFDRALALPPEADFGIMKNRWIAGASEDRVKAFNNFQESFLEGYRSDVNLLPGWQERAELFFALESLERIYSKDARDYLSNYAKLD